ncbi:MAG: glycogen debranching enzyme N-terminal domain-containing protein, partial [Longimicrobiales bacterium]
MTTTQLPQPTLARSALVRPMLWERLERPVGGPDGQAPAEPDWAPLVQREWLLTNGLGGYASGTISGAPTRRYHGLLIAALPAPFGRMLMLAGLGETVRTGDGAEYRLGGEETPERLTLHGAQWLYGFRLEAGLPVWEYRLGDIHLERSVLLLHEQNTVVVRYRVTEGLDPVSLDLRPLVNF